MLPSKYKDAHLVQSGANFYLKCYLAKSEKLPLLRKGVPMQPDITHAAQ